MTELSGTGTLVRAIVRRDRARIALWAAGIVVLVVGSAASVKGLFPTQADLDEAAATAEDSPAAIALNGPPLALDTLGGQVAFQVSSFGLAIVGLMSLLMVTRHTRAEEESGRLDLVRATPVGRHAPTSAALAVVGGLAGLVGAGIALGLAGQGLSVAGSVALGASFTVLGLIFAGIALVTAQVSENTRVASGLAGLELGQAYVTRAAGDVGGGTLSWLSPIGLVQKARPYAGEQWWPLLLGLVLAAALVLVAARLASRRDLGAGFWPPRPGPARAGRLLASPLGIAVRLQRGSLLAWSAGVLLVGAAYGSIANDVEDLLDDSEAIEDILAQAGGTSLTDSYYATTLLVLALFGAGFAVQSALRLRGEESGDRVEPLLATPTSRQRWAGGHLAMAIGGSVAVLAAGGLGMGLMAGLVTGDFGETTRLLGASLAYSPALWVLVGLAVALFGLVPRAAVASWALVAFCLVVGMFGGVLDLPGWVADVSPFQQVPRLPAAGLDLVPLLALTAIAAAFAGVGVVGLRHRDMGR